jgi:hypothetical protein
VTRDVAPYAVVANAPTAELHQSHVKVPLVAVCAVANGPP